jgi:hypothetical protein
MMQRAVRNRLASPTTGAMPDYDAGPDVVPVGRLRCRGRVAAGLVLGTSVVQHVVT